MTARIGYARSLQDHPIDPQAFGFEYAWLEGVMDAKLDKLGAVLDHWADVSRWLEGRLFGATGEYAWCSSGIRYFHAVMILETGELPGGFDGQVDLQAAGDQHLVLGGKWVDPKKEKLGNPDRGPRYYAGEIPNIQTYPLDHTPEVLTEADKEGKTPRLVVRQYRCIEPRVNVSDGNFIRCVGFDLSKEVKEKSDDAN